MSCVFPPAPPEAAFQHFGQGQKQCGEQEQDNGRPEPPRKFAGLLVLGRDIVDIERKRLELAELCRHAGFGNHAGEHDYGRILGCPAEREDDASLNS